MRVMSRTPLFSLNNFACSSINLFSITGIFIDIIVMFKAIALNSNATVKTKSNVDLCYSCDIICHYISFRDEVMYDVSISLFESCV